jgi:hypothetical protein
MLRAYWLDTKPTKLSSALLVVEPSEEQWNRIQTYIAETTDPGFDMEILDASTIRSAWCCRIAHTSC